VFYKGTQSTIYYWLYDYGIKQRKHDKKLNERCQKPSKEQLMKDLNTLSLQEIANKYDRATSTVKYWIDKYDLHHSNLGRPVHCIELNSTFPSLREAAGQVYGEYSDSIAVGISRSAKLNRNIRDITGDL
jgi:hypothetical protein